MPDAGLKARVDRLLSGDIRSEDLTRLFLYVRDHCDGRESVQEIGDFVAHHSERTKGIVTRETRDWFLTTRLKFMALKTPLDGSKLPSNFVEYLWASLRRIGPGIKRSGISSSKARRMLSDLVKKFDANPDGTLAISQKHTAEEINLINYLASQLVARPAFTADRLFNDFSEALKSNGLLAKNKMNDFKKLKPVVLLFAASVMHNCVIRIDEGFTCTLVAAPTGEGETININAPVPTIEDPSVFISSAMFSTGLPMKESCEDSLQATPQPWSFDLEITSAQKLAKLG